MPCHGAATVLCCVRVIGTCVTCVTMTRRGGGEGGRGGGHLKVCRGTCRDMGKLRRSVFAALAASGYTLLEILWLSTVLSPSNMLPVPSLVPLPPSVRACTVAVDHLPLVNHFMLRYWPLHAPN